MGAGNFPHIDAAACVGWGTTLRTACRGGDLWVSPGLGTMPMATFLLGGQRTPPCPVSSRVRRPQSPRWPGRGLLFLFEPVLSEDLKPTLAQPYFQLA